MSVRIKRTPEERRALYEKILELKATGMTIKEASDQLGVSAFNFSNWKEKFEKQAFKTPVKVKIEPKLIPLSPAPVHTQRLVAFVGSPEDVVSAIRSLS